MTNVVYSEQIEMLGKRNAEAEAKLQAYTGEGAKQVTEEEVDRVKSGYEKYQKYWRVRRRACHEIVDMICDSVDQNRKEFFEQVGLETDEDYGVSIAEFDPNTTL